MFENEEEAKNCRGIWVTVSVVASCSFLSLITALGFCNSYRYLIKKKKYRAYPLTLCYVACQFTLLAAIARSVSVQLIPHTYAWLLIVNIEAFGMLCVGVSQIVTMLELTFKTRQLTLALELENKPIPEGSFREDIRQIQFNRAHARYNRAIQWLYRGSAVVCVILLVVSQLVIFIIKARLHEYEGKWTRI